MTRPAANLATRPLFGGAVIMDLPAEYIDASDLRQIPDNQEVFLSHSSETSVVLEVLAMVQDGLASTDLYEAVKFHFESIAHDNASLSSTILTPPPATPIPSTPVDQATLTSYTPTPLILAGTQRIHKFSYNPSGAPRPGHETDQPDEVWIAVALWRCWVESAGPIAIEGEVAGAGAGEKKKKKADLVLSVNVNLSAEDGKGQEERRWVEEWFARAVGSLRIEDWNLFGDSA